MKFCNLYFSWMFVSFSVSGTGKRCYI
ncbi:hypothetical protein F383_13595 [Gossypium arboreum]|uniref:Uncharacterized protein n=1 Tax=Gossypium arboreum TaxID=29729 RepID=A0A0B0NCK1_GOSAR|nr:hypothetical protein F383_36674 [Gossypium arboreum]KHG09544.1 hypothetical protein F383_13595 [Gossypium arboreum]